MRNRTCLEIKQQQQDYPSRTSVFILQPKVLMAFEVWLYSSPEKVNNLYKVYTSKFREEVRLGQAQARLDTCL